MTGSEREKIREFIVLHRFMHYATRKGRTNSFYSLITSDCLNSIIGSVDFVSNGRNSIFSHSALEQAIYFENIEAVKILLKLGANPFKQGTLGWTPMLWALMLGNVDIVKLLVGYSNSFLCENISSRCQYNKTSYKIPLGDFLLYGQFQNVPECISALKKSKLFHAELEDLFCKLGERKRLFTANATKGEFIRIALDTIRMDQMIVLHEQNRLVLFKALIKSPQSEFFCFQWNETDAKCVEFTLPIPANAVALASRYEYFVGKEESWQAFLTDCINEFVKRFDGCVEFDEKLFWFSNIIQILTYIKNERSIICPTCFLKHVENIVNYCFVLLVGNVCECLQQEIEDCILTYQPENNIPNQSNRNSSVAFDRKELKTKMKTALNKIYSLTKEKLQASNLINGKLHTEHRNTKSIQLLANPPQYTKKSPSRLISMLNLIYQSANKHFYPMDGLVDSQISLKIIKSSLSFINYFSIATILSNQQKYCDKLHGMAIRMNISEIENWLQDMFLESNSHTFHSLLSALHHLITMCQYLELYSCLERESAFEEFAKFCQIHEASSEFLEFITAVKQQKLSVCEIVGGFEDVNDITNELNSLNERFLISNEIFELFFTK